MFGQWHTVAVDNSRSPNRDVGCRE